MDRGPAVAEAEQDRQAGLLLVAHPGVEGAAPVGRVGQPAKPFRLLGPEAPRKAQVDLAENAAAVAQPVERGALRLWRHRVEDRQAGAQQAHRDGDHRPVRLDPLAALQHRGDASAGPDDALDDNTVANVELLRRIVDQRAEAPLGLGVAVEALGREPFLRRDLVPRRTLHALAHLDEGRHHQLVDLRQPPGTQQRFDRLFHGDRARPVHTGHRLALPTRPFDRSLEGHAPHHRAAALALARRRRRALVDQQSLTLVFDQLDAELLAPQRQRITFDAMDPRAAEIERRAEAIVGPHAAAQAPSRFQHGDTKA